MNKLILALLLMFSGSLFAVDSLRAGSGENQITIHQTPCTSEKAKSLVPKLNLLAKSRVTVDQLKNAEVVSQGRKIKACWVLVGQAVAILDEDDEDENVYPMRPQDFRPVETI